VHHDDSDSAFVLSGRHAVRLPVTVVANVAVVATAAFCNELLRCLR